jgi:hypothetical protein
MRSSISNRVFRASMWGGYEPIPEYYLHSNTERFYAVVNRLQKSQAITRNVFRHIRSLFEEKWGCKLRRYTSNS